MQTTAPGTAGPTPGAPATGLDVVVTGTSSDAHTWNLIYLELLLTEWGHRVSVLGACVPEELVVTEALACRPDLVVVGSVNGHGAADGLRLIAAIRAEPRLAALPVVIGGKLGTAEDTARAALPRLRAAGFTGVFEESAGTAPFRRYLDTLTAGVCR
ncbi:methylaspartate mutase [Streptomyces zinciresistens K42]|uniref:Methylaspartate mutase n=1 Tax=Streptomyces zinciresistens K42 TaxID=700597 RepID=G2GER1_9ACTN|nr:cobalamin-dependent protein [Streptomyces zinciresistens]EGX58022.1 methylaspartate mutase [Streptomyces zinciresistens K42]